MDQINKTQNFKDVSRFTRWVNELDKKDKELKPLIRKIKWIVISALLFTLFGISFICFPTGRIKPQKIETTSVKPGEKVLSPTVRSVFELPVDSFEIHLKYIIHEKISEKK